MPQEKRTVEDRQMALQPVADKAHLNLNGMRAMFGGRGGEEFHCTIDGSCRTQIFEFPGIDFHPDGDEPHHEIYASPSIRACLTSDLVVYFEDSTGSKHYSISPPLRYDVDNAFEKVKSEQKTRIPVFLVIEETNQLTPVEMAMGECTINDETFVRDGKIQPALRGGREGEKFLIAWATSDGAWPELPNNQKLVNMILAAVRVSQQTPDAIRKYVDQSCLVTDDGRYVMVQPGPRFSARATVSTPMDPTAFRERASEISAAIAAMEEDIDSAHMALLFNSMYRDEYKDDDYLRLHYLQLWQSLEESAKKLGYPRKIKDNNNDFVAGKKSLGELRVYRHDIAHWWTDNLDENYLSELYRTINGLIRRKYF